MGEIVGTDYETRKEAMRGLKRCWETSVGHMRHERKEEAMSSGWKNKWWSPQEGWEKGEGEDQQKQNLI